MLRLPRFAALLLAAMSTGMAAYAYPPPAGNNFKLPPPRPPINNNFNPSPSRPPTNNFNVPPARPPANNNFNLPPARPPANSFNLPPARPPANNFNQPPSRTNANVPPARPQPPHFQANQPNPAEAARLAQTKKEEAIRRALVGTGGTGAPPRTNPGVPAARPSVQPQSPHLQPNQPNPTEAARLAEAKKAEAIRRALVGNGGTKAPPHIQANQPNPAEAARLAAAKKAEAIHRAFDGTGGTKAPPPTIAKVRDAKNRDVVARAEKLTPDQKTKFKTFEQSVAKNQAALRKPGSVTTMTSVSTRKPVPSTTKPPVSKTDLAKAVQGKTQADPNLKQAVDKLTGKNPQPLKKGDLAALKRNLPPGKAKGFGLNGDPALSLSPGQRQILTDLAGGKGPASGVDPKFRTALQDYLAGGAEALTPAEVSTLQNGLKSDLASGKFPAKYDSAVSAALADVRNVQNAQQALATLQKLNGGGGGGGGNGRNVLGSFLGAAGGALVGTLLSGGGVLGYPPGGGGGYFPGGGDFLPPEVPTLFYPSDQTAQIDPDDAYPSVPGVALAITGPPQGDDVPSGTGDYDDLGGLPVAAAPWQTTRYLRLANATGQNATFFVRYLVEDEGVGTAWLPPADGDWATFNLQPGETADVMDGDWHVNARQACILARSETSEWNQFQTRPLVLVADDQPYQSPEPDVFNYTVR